MIWKQLKKKKSNTICKLYIQLLYITYNKLLYI